MDYVIIILIGFLGGMPLGVMFASAGLPLIGFAIWAACLGFSIWAVWDVIRMNNRE